MKIAMKNPANGQLKEIKVGWSWTIFFFSWFFGVPLFLRGLTLWGLTMVALAFAKGLLGDLQLLETLALVSFCEFSLTIYLAAKGNELSAKTRLKNGWTFLDPESDAVKYAKGKWGIL